jgi:uncharacterized protein
MAVIPEPSHLAPASPHTRPHSHAVAGENAVLNPPTRLEGHGHRFYQSPVRFFALLWAFFTNIPRQFEILRVLRLPAFARLARADRILPFKYLTRDYLMRGLPVRERAAAFVHHYRRISTAFPPEILQQILDSEVALLEKAENGHRASVQLGFARTQVREGELALSLKVDGVTVYVLQFTIVPGWVVNSRAAEVFLVSRLQGIKGCYPQVYLATKAFSDVAPPALLLALLHGIAQACSINEMAGVSAKSQFSYMASAADSFHAAYDQYWLELGATRISASFYACPIPPDEKSLDGIKNGHKSRTRKKREFKRRIAQDAYLLLQGWIPQLGEELATLEAALAAAPENPPVKRITLRPIPPKSSQPS